MSEPGYSYSYAERVLNLAELFCSAARDRLDHGDDVDFEDLLRGFSNVARRFFYNTHEGLQ